MNISEIERLAISTAMRKLFESKWFDICTVDQCLKVSGIIAPRREYEILRTLHCVHYADMPRELLESLPGLLSACFNGVNIAAMIAASEPARAISESRKRLQ